MVGFNGQPLRFGNALDYFRRVLFCNRTEAERVYAEFLGNPSELSDQDRPGPYRDHVPVQYRKRPHKLGEVHGEPPVHAMLAAYSGNVVMLPPAFQPAIGLCVITTQKNCRGNVILSVWQEKLYFSYAEGMKFHLLDCMGGNIPAVMSCGVLHVDECGRYPSAPDEIHQLWDQAQAFFLQQNGYVGGMTPATTLKQSLSFAGLWFRTQRQLQWQLAQIQQQRQSAHPAPAQQHTSTAIPILQRPIELAQQKAIVPKSRKRKNRADFDSEKTEPRKDCKLNRGSSSTQHKTPPRTASTERYEGLNKDDDGGKQTSISPGTEIGQPSN